MKAPFKIFNADNLEILRQIPDSTVDALVTDPPAGISFMNKKWDDDKGGRDEWIRWLSDVLTECHRVLKPGAHALIWAIPRTSHWTGMAIENAGFEVRDVVTHLFGQGFPKSMNISKAIDKAAGAEREIVGKKSTYRKPQSPNGWDCTTRAEFETAPATPDAEKWDGWGTALKPACEFWILARKPCSEKTVAANVLKWGTGGLNIDGCRIETSGLDKARHLDEWNRRQSVCNNTTRVAGQKDIDPRGYAKEGRFPANLVLDEEAGEMLGEEKRFFYCAKVSTSERNAGLDSAPKKVNDGRETPIDNPFQRGETLRKNTHPTVKPLKLMEYLCKLVTPPGGIILDPFMGSGSTGIAARKLGFKFVGVEREAEYFEIAKTRIEHFEEEEAA